MGAALEDESDRGVMSPIFIIMKHHRKATVRKTTREANHFVDDLLIASVMSKKVSFCERY